MKYVLPILAIFSMIFFSCKKDSFITTGDARILTADTVHFDTIFTSKGSITQVFKIFNQNDQKLKISEISLGGGSSSFFTININGTPGPALTNLEIEANDSIYIFTSVLIDPNSETLPFLVRDSILISYNGNKNYVQLTAYGQNAHFLNKAEITENITWTADLPYVIQGGITVKENATLTVEEGVTIYFSANSPMLVEGTLRVAGQKHDTTRVRFLGDRRDLPYSQYPGSWPGIYFKANSKNNVLDYAIIKNAYQGIIAEGLSVTAQPKLTLNQCIIDNIIDAGILGIRTSITATNCLVSNAGGESSNNICLLYGGVYDFNHCTVASFGNNYVNHKNPVLNLSNYITDNTTLFSGSLDARFRNCIFWGEGGLVEDEVVVTKEGTHPFNAVFTNCLWKAKSDPENIVATNIIRNQSPSFDSTNTVRQYFDFRLKDDSPAFDNGIATGISEDLDGNSRPGGALPDIGAYERP